MKKNILLILLLSFYNVFAQWEECNNGIIESYIDEFLIKDGVLFAGFKYCYYTTNNGENWIRTDYNGTPIISMLSLDDYLFVGTAFSGIQRSTDNGRTWTKYNNFNGVDILYSLDNEIYAGTNKGLYKSTDYGNEWINISNDALFSKALSMVSINNLLLVGTNNGIFKTTNSGLTWSKFNSVLDEKIVSALVTNDNNLFAIANNEIFLSTDYGYSWTKKNRGIEYVEIKSLYSFGNSILAVSKDHVIYHSSNMGSNWSIIPSNFTYLGIGSIIEYNGYLFLSVLTGGIFRAKLSELGINSVNVKNFQFVDFDLYPNPADKILYVTAYYPKSYILEQGNTNTIKLVFYSYTGRKICEKIVTAGKEIQIPIHNVEQGLYFIRAERSSSQKSYNIVAPAIQSVVIQR